MSRPPLPRPESRKRQPQQHAEWEPLPYEVWVMAPHEVGCLSRSNTHISLSSSQLDSIYDHVRHMPDPGRILHPLGWFALGVAATAGLEGYNAEAGTAHRHVFIAVSITTAITGVCVLFAATKLTREQQKHAKWLLTSLDKLYADFGLQPPAYQPVVKRPPLIKGPKSG